MPAKESTEGKLDQCKNELNEKSLTLPPSEQHLTARVTDSCNIVNDQIKYHTLEFAEAMNLSQISRLLLLQYSANDDSTRCE